MMVKAVWQVILTKGNLINPHFSSIDKLNFDECLDWASASKLYLDVLQLHVQTWYRLSVWQGW